MLQLTDFLRDRYFEIYQGILEDEFEEEGSPFCVVCWDQSLKPVTLNCEHTICRSCLKNQDPQTSCCTACWEFKHLRTLQDDIVMYPEGRSICEMHQEEEKLFCENNQTLLCVTCSKSEHHKYHIHWPIAVAALRYRKKIKKNLEILHQNVQKIQKLIMLEKEKCMGWVLILTEKKNEAMRIFEKEIHIIQKYLKSKKEKAKTEQEEELIEGKTDMRLRELYRKLREVEATQECKIMQQKKEWEAMMSRQSKPLMDKITEFEEKIQKPNVELLQDFRDTLERCYRRPNLKPFIPKLDHSYIIVATEFLQLLESFSLPLALGLLKNYNCYNLSEDKRFVIIAPGSSGEIYVTYVTGSVQIETIKQTVFFIPRRKLSSLMHSFFDHILGF